MHNQRAGADAVTTCREIAPCATNEGARGWRRRFHSGAYATLLRARSAVRGSSKWEGFLAPDRLPRLAHERQETGDVRVRRYLRTHRGQTEIPRH